MHRILLAEDDDAIGPSADGFFAGGGLRRDGGGRRALRPGGPGTGAV